MRTRQERSHNGERICPASILLHNKAVRRSFPDSRVSASLVKTSRINVLVVQPETPDPDPRLRVRRMVPMKPGGRLRRGSASWASWIWLIIYIPNSHSLWGFDFDGVPFCEKPVRISYYSNKRTEIYVNNAFCIAYFPQVLYKTSWSVEITLIIISLSLFVHKH